MKNNKKAQLIKKCRSCGSKKLSTILTLGKLALSDFVTSNQKPNRYPLTLVLCVVCRLVQLKHTVSQSQLYTERYGYKSGINNTMQQELREVVQKAQEMIQDGNEQYTVIDIGANDGTLLGNYGKKIFKIGIEPIKKFAEECKKHSDVVINDFFNYKSYFKTVGDKKAHIITSISCFYDMEEPNQFIVDAKKVLHEHGVLIIQQNYLVDMLKNNAFDNIVHEHLEYYSLLSLENLLSKHDLEIFHVEVNEVNGGSFRTYISHKGKRKINKSVVQLRNQEKKLRLHKKEIYEQFAKRVKNNKDTLTLLIKKLRKDNKKIYIYGASTRGNTLIQYFGLDKCSISAAVERNKEKWGKKIASVGIPIISEEQARREKPDYMLVLPWFFKEEFLQREKNYLKLGGHFIFPLPRLEVV